jgi:hypothetical protein
MVKEEMVCVLVLREMALEETEEDNMAIIAIIEGLIKIEDTHKGRIIETIGMKIEEIETGAKTLNLIKAKSITVEEISMKMIKTEIRNMFLINTETIMATKISITRISLIR